MILWWASLNGPTAMPGNYKVLLTVNGETQQQDFRILMSPVSEGSMEDIKAQFDFVKGLQEKVSEAHQAITDIRGLKAQIKSYTEKLSDMDIKEYAKKMDSLATTVENNLYQTKNRSGQDPLNFPIKLTNKLAHLNSLLNMGVNDFAPTQSMIEVRDELSKRIDNELEQWKKVKEDMVSQLNQMMREKKIEHIQLK
jgi:hypothetical protein